MSEELATQKQIDYAVALGNDIARLMGDSPKAKVRAARVGPYVASLGKAAASKYISELIVKRDHLKLQMYDGGQAKFSTSTLASTVTVGGVSLVATGDTSAPATFVPFSAANSSSAMGGLKLAIEKTLEKSAHLDLDLATYKVALHTSEYVPVQSTEVPMGYYLVEQQSMDSHSGYTKVVCVTEYKGTKIAKRLWISTSGAKKKARWVRRWNLLKVLEAGNVAFTPLTQDQAAELGHLHGFCVLCGKQLTDPGSVQHGIGPVCMKKQGWKGMV